MKNKINSVFIVIIAMITIAKGQTNHVYFISGGLTFQKSKETRFTSNFRSGIGYNVSMGYERQTEKSINRVSLLFIQASQGKSNISFSRNLRPEIRYEYLKKNKSIDVGGFIDIGSLISFRNGTWANENSISYCMWSSLGISTQFKKSINVFDKKAEWKTCFSSPLLSYLVRPSYSFPYTDNFLTQEKFNLNRTNLRKAIVTSGKFKSIGSFTNIRVQTGVDFVTENKKWSWGINYALGYLQTKEAKPLFQFNHQINFVAQKLNVK